MGPVGCPPEMKRVAKAAVDIRFVHFRYDQIFKKCSLVRPGFHRLKIVDESVSQATVKKVNFCHFSDFFSTVSGIRRESKDDKALFKKRQIPADGFSVNRKFVCELAYVDQIPYLKGQETEKVSCRGSVFDK